MWSKITPCYHILTRSSSRIIILDQAVTAARLTISKTVPEALLWEETENVDLEKEDVEDFVVDFLVVGTLFTAIVFLAAVVFLTEFAFLTEVVFLRDVVFFVDFALTPIAFLVVVVSVVLVVVLDVVFPALGTILPL
jgi:hypothetical protein